MLTDSQSKTLVAALARGFPINLTVQVLEIYVGETLAGEVPHLARPRDVAEWLVMQALSRPEPTVLIRLIRRVDDGSGRLGSLVSLADSLQDDPEGWRAIGAPDVMDGAMLGDPLHVTDGRPFVDRASFRNLLPRIGAPDSPTCTLVLGDRGHGKSYLYQFCRQLDMHWGRGHQRVLPVGYALCPSTNLADIDPAHVARQLAPGLKTDGSRRPRAHEDPFRLGENLVAWLTEFTPPAPLPALVIFDGFDGADAGTTDRVPPSVLYFIEHLISVVQGDPEIASRMRVVLLGYERSRLDELELAYETSILEWVEATHVSEWFRRRYPTAPEYRHEDAAAAILGEVESDRDSLRLGNICSLMQITAQEFE